MDKKATSLSSNNDSVNSISTMHFDSKSHDVSDLAQSPTTSSKSGNMASNITTSSTTLVNIDMKEDREKRKEASRKEEGNEHFA